MQQSDCAASHNNNTDNAPTLVLPPSNTRTTIRLVSTMEFRVNTTHKPVRNNQRGKHMAAESGSVNEDTTRSYITDRSAQRQQSQCADLVNTPTFCPAHGRFFFSHVV